MPHSQTRQLLYLENRKVDNENTSHSRLTMQPTQCPIFGTDWHSEASLLSSVTLMSLLRMLHKSKDKLYQNLCEKLGVCCVLEVEL